MSYGKLKTEHAGPKHGRGAYHGPRDIAKEFSDVRRRIADREFSTITCECWKFCAMDALTGTKHVHKGETCPMHPHAPVAG